MSQLAVNVFSASSYTPDIGERCEFIVNQFESRRRWVDDLQPILLERAEVEQVYAKSLAKLANSLEKYSQKNNLEKGISSIVLSVRSVVLTQSEQAQNQSEQLKNDAVSGLKAGIKRQSEEISSLKTKVTFLKSELSRHLAELEKQKQEYYRNYKQFNRSKQHVLTLQLAHSSPILAVLNENEALLLENQKVLDESISRYNTFLDQYFTEIALANQSQNTMDEARLSLIKDALLKTLVYQISAIKNVEYDTHQISDKIEKYERVEQPPIFMETQERMMLSKLNFNNYINYVHSECSIPHLDKALYAKLDSTSLETTKELNQSLKRFLDLFGQRKKPVSSQVSSLSSPKKNLWREGTGGGDYLKLFAEIFYERIYLEAPSIQKFKERIEGSEKERILFSIALDHFSYDHSQIIPSTASGGFKERAITDLIFLVSTLFDKSESQREVDLIERCYRSFREIIHRFLPSKSSNAAEIYQSSLQQHAVLRSADFWAQDSLKKITQQQSRDFRGGISNGGGGVGINHGASTKQSLADLQLRLDIPRWRSMQFSKEFQQEILNIIANACRIDEEKRTFYLHVIQEKEKFVKKPIFGASKPFNSSPSLIAVSSSTASATVTSVIAPSTTSTSTASIFTTLSQLSSDPLDQLPQIPLLPELLSIQQDDGI